MLGWVDGVGVEWKGRKKLHGDEQPQYLYSTHLEASIFANGNSLSMPDALPCTSKLPNVPAMAPHPTFQLYDSLLYRHTEKVEPQPSHPLPVSAQPITTLTPTILLLLAQPSSNFILSLPLFPPTHTIPFQPSPSMLNPPTDMLEKPRHQHPPFPSSPPKIQLPLSLRPSTHSLARSAQLNLE